jgi:3-oxoacyl-[acyl-carrier protein] reductase
MTAGVAVITGAGQGLGEAIARGLHSAGYRVCLADINAEAAQAVAKDIDASSDTALGMATDVRRQADFEAVRDALVAKWGRIDVLVNNAALTKVQAVLDIAPDDFDAVMAVNVRGTFIGCQVFARYFKDRGYGRIINMASLAGQNGGSATGAHYAASKGAILTLTKVFARDLAAFGITVNAIAPGPLDIPSVRELIGEDKLESVAKTIPVGAFGEAGFVADMVVQLARPAARFVTGATWDVNGGLYVR